MGRSTNPIWPGSLGRCATSPTCVSEWLAAAASSSGPVSHAASVAVTTAPVILCERIAAGEIPTLMANDESQISVRFDDGVQVDAIGLALGGLAACEPLAETELVETESSLLSAGALIMGLRAEVVWGEPALVHSQELHLGKMDITPQPIEWRRVEPVLTACAIARAALAQRSGTTAPVIVAKGSPPSDSSTVDSEAVGNDVPNSPEEGSSAESLSVGPSAEPADLAAFLREVVSIAQTTEQRWSEALGAAVGDDVGDLVAKGRSLLAALGRQVIQEDGAGPVLPGIPLTPATANGLSVMPEGAQREIQHAIAVVQVLAELALAIEALRRPTGLRITLPEGTVTSWWTQHGFNHVQYRAEMATRVVMQDASDPSADRARMGLLAQAAWTAGLPEAAIVYLVGDVGSGHRGCWGSCGGLCLTAFYSEDVGYGRSRFSRRRSTACSILAGRVGEAAPRTARDWQRRLGFDVSVQLSSTPADPYGLVDSASDIRPIVFFGDVDVSSAMLGIQTKNAVNTMASANVQFDALAPVLADVDFTSEVTIARGDRDAGRVFTGYAVEAIVEDGFLKVECQGYPALHDPPSGARISRTSAVDNIHTILREAGLPDSRLQLAGLDQLPIEVFEAVIPIDGLILSTRVALGEVVLLPNGSAEEHVLGLIDAPDNPLVGEFQAGRAFAVTYVTAARMYEAERAAIGRVDVAIAWANVRLRFAGAVTPAGELVDWNRARSKQLASRSDLIALRGMLTNRCSLHKMAAPAVTELALTSEQNVSGQGLASDAGLRGAIRAAARAISSPDPLTKITAISECLEFYVGSTDASFGFTKAERRALAKAAHLRPSACDSGTG
jgi:hypothetical protein